MLVLSFILIVLFGLVIPCLIILFAVFEIRSGFLGAPYVPTTAQFVDEILKKAALKKGSVFIELGSGDGRMVRAAVKNYGMRGVGIELNPLLVIYAALLAYLQGLKEIQFKRENFFDTNLKNCDVLFLFLLPKTLAELREKLFKECKNKLIISHGFKIEGFEKYLIEKQDRKIFPTYFYQLKQKTTDVNPWGNALNNTALAVRLRRYHGRKAV